MAAVFISYRREESAGEARALYNDLVDALGKDAVFMDVDSIALGQDFRQVVQQRLGVCDLMLALVGKEWLTVTNRSGGRRIDDPGDFVRLEIEAALKRQIAVAPVLLHGTQMPSPDQLPEGLRDFAYRNAFELSHTRWESDVKEMLRRLALSAQPQQPPPVTPDRSSAARERDEIAPSPAPAPVAASVVRPRGGLPMLVAAAIALVVLAVGGYAWFGGSGGAGESSGAAADTEAAVVDAPADDTTDPQLVETAAPEAAAESTAEPPADAPIAAAPGEDRPIAATATARDNVSLANQSSGQDKCLDHLTIGPCGDFTGQIWRIDPVGDGLHVRLHNAFAGRRKCLDVVNNGQNAALDMADCGEFTGQQWTMLAAGPANRFLHLRNEFTGPEWCLTVVDFDGRNGDIRMARCNGTAAQRWRLTSR